MAKPRRITNATPAEFAAAVTKRKAKPRETDPFRWPPCEVCGAWADTVTMAAGDMVVRARCEEHRKRAEESC